MNQDFDPEGLEEPTDPPQVHEPEPTRAIFGETLVRVLEDVVKSLHETEGIFDVVMAFEPPVPAFNVTSVENGLGRSLPEDIKAFYRTTDGFKISWSGHTPQGEPTGGLVQVHDFHTLFGYWFDTLWIHDDAHSEAHQEFIWSLRGLSPGPQDAPQEMTTLRLLGDFGSDYALHLRHDQDNLSPMHIDFASYIYYGLETRGIHGWRHILSEAPTPESISAPFLDALTHLFPEVDEQPYRALCATHHSEEE